MVNFAAAKKHNDSYNTGVRKPNKLEKYVWRANSSSQKKNSLFKAGKISNLYNLATTVAMSYM